MKDYILNVVPYSKLIDLEDPEYENIQINFAIVRESDNYD